MKQCRTFGSSARVDVSRARAEGAKETLLRNFPTLATLEKVRNRLVRFRLGMLLKWGVL